VLLVVLARPDFSMTASPGAVSVGQGRSITTTVSTRSRAGTAETIAFSATDLLAGLTATFAANSTTAGGSSTLTLAVDATMPPGRYTITITGTAPSATHTATVLLDVTAALDVTAPPSQGGGCGCNVDPEANAMNGGLFAIVLGFIVRRRRRLLRETAAIATSTAPAR
jgi:MYXO-CTERM domain-containing protein